MSQPILVDASAWVAIANRKDRNHREAVQIFRRLLGSSSRLVSTTWTACEAVTIVKSRLGFRQAERLWDRIESKAVVDLIWIDRQIERNDRGNALSIQAQVASRC
jgi:predicted nucleic acid-binding protein